MDAAANPGEGLFREVSISRSLFKSTNSCASGCTNTNYFAKIWQAIENDTAGVGMGKATYPFRSTARYYSRLLQSFSGVMPASIDSILNSDEAQQREVNAAYTVGGFRVSVPYGIKLVPSGPACSLKIQPRSDSGLNTNNLSDQRFSNHFYLIDLASLPGVTEIWLDSTFSAGTTNIDIDAILYKEGYNFDNDCTDYSAGGVCISAQKATSTDMVRYDRTVGNGTKKLQSLTSLNSALKYLLDVRAYTTGISILSNTEYTYTLRDQLGGYLCPIATY